MPFSIDPGYRTTLIRKERWIVVFRDSPRPDVVLLSLLARTIVGVGVGLVRHFDGATVPMCCS